MTNARMNGYDRGHDNPVFTSDDFTFKPRDNVNGFSNGVSNGFSIDDDDKKIKEPETQGRAVWSNKLEFLMACIALSVIINWNFSLRQIIIDV